MPSALDWAVVYLVSAVVGTGVGLVLVNRELGRPEFHFLDLGSHLREGVFFSLSLSAQNSLNDSDKAILARLATLEATGVYAAAWRLVGAMLLPIGSLQAATTLAFFNTALEGVRVSARSGASDLAAGRVLRCVRLPHSISSRRRRLLSWETSITKRWQLCGGGQLSRSSGHCTTSLGMR